MKLSKERTLFYFILFPTLSAIFLNVEIPVFKMITIGIGWWQILAFIIAIIGSIRRIKKYYLQIIVLQCLFLSTLLIAMFVNGDSARSIIYFVRTYIPIITFIIMLNRVKDNRRNDFITVIHHIIMLYVYLNGLLLLLFPNGIFQSYTERVDVAGWKLYQRCNLLGVDNRLCIVFISAIVICEIYYSINKLSFVTKWIGYGVMLLQEVFVWSGSGILALSLMIILVIIIQYKKEKPKLEFIQYQNAVIVYLLFFVSICLLNMVSLWAPIIVGFLGKDMTFTNRTYIWEIAIKQILKSPIIGYGKCDTRDYILFAGYYWYAHNLILDIILQGGIIALLSFGGVIIKCGRKTESYLDKMCVAGIFTMLMINLIESFVNSIYFWIPFFLFYSLKTNVVNIERIGKKSERIKNRLH